MVRDTKVYVVGVPNRRYFQLRYQDADGRWRQISAKTCDRMLAEESARQLSKRLLAGVTHVELPWVKFCHRYRRKIVSAMNSFARDCWRATEVTYSSLRCPAVVSDVTSESVKEYCSAMRELGRSDHAVSSFRTALCDALLWAYQMRYVPCLPRFSGYKDALAKKPSCEFTPEEIERMADAVPSVVCSMMKGMRVSVVPSVIASWRWLLRIYSCSQLDVESLVGLHWEHATRPAIVSVGSRSFRMERNGEHCRIHPDFTRELRAIPAEDRVGRVVKVLDGRGNVITEPDQIREIIHELAGRSGAAR